jgi:proline dehydrogenase
MILMLLRKAVLAAARSDRLRDGLAAAPGTRAIVRRFVAGETVAEAIATAIELCGSGLKVSLDHLGEDTTDRAGADAMRESCLDLLNALEASGLTGCAEVSVKLSALGQALGADGDKIAYENAYKICELAARHGTTITVDMEDHTTTDATLSTVRDLRVDFPWVGAVLQAYLRRTEGDLKELVGPGSRIRLCKGAYAEPESVAFTDQHDIDRNYVRCLKILMANHGHPMIATHDPRLIAIASQLAVSQGRGPERFEFQMLHGVRPAEQLRLASAGNTVRVYVPFGSQWYGYLMRRLAERPANLAFFARSLLTTR